MSSIVEDRGWRLRTFQPGDEAGITKLLAAGFDRPLDEAAWRWKLLDRPSPVANVWLAVDGDDRPIFHYGGIARRLTIGAEERDLMVAVDSTTAPEHRRRGILTAGGAAAHQAWGAAGFAGVLGLPNEQWRSRVDALGWRPLFPLKWCIRPLRPERLLAKRLGLGAVGRLGFLGRGWNMLWRRRLDPSIEVRRVDDLGELDGFWEICRQGDHLSLVRDREWLEWRYLSCPLHRYRILAATRSGRPAGYLVDRFDDESAYGFIAELVTAPADRGARRALVDAALDRSSRRRAVAVATLAVPGSELHRTYRGAGFLFSWGSFRVCTVPLADDPPLASLRDPRRWWLHGGDFDVI